MVISFPESWSGKLGGTDYSNLVGPILVISYLESLHCNLGSTDCLNSVRPILVMDIHREITIPHLDETKIPIGRTDLLRVWQWL